MNEEENIMNLLNATEDLEFYPTPVGLVKKMLDGLDVRKIKTVLEPSAGKGNILRELAKKETDYGWNDCYFDVDCIEKDINLQQILKYNFLQRKKDLEREIEQITKGHVYEKESLGLYKYYDGRNWNFTSEEETGKIDKNKSELECFFKKGIHIVHDDFLTFNTYKKYDLIIMNPPFSNGDKHLLKALEMQKDGGSIICLLNAETLKNPYSNSRKALVKLLKEYNASIEFLQDTFSKSERKTDVEIALIKVYIEEQEQMETDIFTKLKEGMKYKDLEPEQNKELAVGDIVKAAVAEYRLETSVAIKLIKEYISIKSRIKDFKLCLQLSKDDRWNSKNKIELINGVIEEIRLKYWEKLFNNDKITSRFPNKVKQMYLNKVNEFKDYDFSEFNINCVISDMNANIKEGIENSIMELFDEMTYKHSYWEDCKENIHLYNGWKTNKAHKIDKKVILREPYITEYNYYTRKNEFCNRGIVRTIEEIERILNYFDGNMSASVNTKEVISEYINNGKNRNIPLKFFKASFFKKGTVHLVFSCPELIERFNIYAGQRKGWLPPSYGTKKYEDMTQEEKSVIDSFQGEKNYKKVIEDSNYYLAPVVSKNTMPLLAG